MRKTTASRTKKIEVSTLGGEVKIVKVPVDATVEECLEAAGYDYTEGTKVKCDGDEYELDDVPEDGDELYLVKGSKGGC